MIKSQVILISIICNCFCGGNTNLQTEDISKKIADQNAKTMLSNGGKRLQSVYLNADKSQNQFQKIVIDTIGFNQNQKIKKEHAGLNHGQNINHPKLQSVIKVENEETKKVNEKFLGQKRNPEYGFLGQNPTKRQKTDMLSTNNVYPFTQILNQPFIIQPKTQNLGNFDKIFIKKDNPQFVSNINKLDEQNLKSMSIIKAKNEILPNVVNMNTNEHLQKHRTSSMVVAPKVYQNYIPKSVDHINSQSFIKLKNRNIQNDSSNLHQNDSFIIPKKLILQPENVYQHDSTFLIKKEKMHQNQEINTESFILKKKKEEPKLNNFQTNIKLPLIEENENEINQPDLKTIKPKKNYYQKNPENMNLESFIIQKKQNQEKSVQPDFKQPISNISPEMINDNKLKSVLNIQKKDKMIEKDSNLKTDSFFIKNEKKEQNQNNFQSKNLQSMIFLKNNEWTFKENEIDQKNLQTSIVKKKENFILSKIPDLSTIIPKRKSKTTENKVDPNNLKSFLKLKKKSDLKNEEVSTSETFIIQSKKEKEEDKLAKMLKTMILIPSKNPIDKTKVNTDTKINLVFKKIDKLLEQNDLIERLFSEKVSIVRNFLLEMRKLSFKFYNQKLLQNLEEFVLSFDTFLQTIKVTVIIDAQGSLRYFEEFDISYFQTLMINLFELSILMKDHFKIKNMPAEINNLEQIFQNFTEALDFFCAKYKIIKISQTQYTFDKISEKSQVHNIISALESERKKVIEAKHSSLNPYIDAIFENLTLLLTINTNKKWIFAISEWIQRVSVWQSYFKLITEIKTNKFYFYFLIEKSVFKQIKESISVLESNLQAICTINTESNQSQCSDIFQNIYFLTKTIETSFKQINENMFEERMSNLKDRTAQLFYETTFINVHKLRSYNELMTVEQMFDLIPQKYNEEKIQLGLKFSFILNRFYYIFNSIKIIHSKKSFWRENKCFIDVLRSMNQLLDTSSIQKIPGISNAFRPLVVFQKNTLQKTFENVSKFEKCSKPELGEKLNQDFTNLSILISTLESIINQSFHTESAVYEFSHQEDVELIFPEFRFDRLSQMFVRKITTLSIVNIINRKITFITSIDKRSSNVLKQEFDLLLLTFYQNIAYYFQWLEKKPQNLTFFFELVEKMDLLRKNMESYRIKQVRTNSQKIISYLRFSKEGLDEIIFKLQKLSRDVKIYDANEISKTLTNISNNSLNLKNWIEKVKVIGDFAYRFEKEEDFDIFYSENLDKGESISSFLTISQSGKKMLPMKKITTPEKQNEEFLESNIKELISDKIEQSQKNSRSDVYDDEVKSLKTENEDLVEEFFDENEIKDVIKIEKEIQIVDEVEESNIAPKTSYEINEKSSFDINKSNEKVEKMLNEENSYNNQILNGKTENERRKNDFEIDSQFDRNSLESILLSRSDQSETNDKNTEFSLSSKKSQSSQTLKKVSQTDTFEEKKDQSTIKSTVEKKEASKVKVFRHVLVLSYLDCQECINDVFVKFVMRNLKQSNIIS